MDWDAINVVSGGWWLVLIAIAILLVGFSAGVTYARRNKEISSV